MENCETSRGPQKSRLENPTRADLEVALEGLDAKFRGKDEVFVLVPSLVLHTLKAHGRFPQGDKFIWLQMFNPRLAENGTTIVFECLHHMDLYLQTQCLDVSDRSLLINRREE